MCPNSDMDYRIFNMRTWLFLCVHKHTQTHTCLHTSRSSPPHSTKTVKITEQGKSQWALTKKNLLQKESFKLGLEVRQGTQIPQIGRTEVSTYFAINSKQSGPFAPVDGGDEIKRDQVMHADHIVCRDKEWMKLLFHVVSHLRFSDFRQLRILHDNRSSQTT